MNRLTRYARNTALSLATIATLYGCGGGGDSSPTSPGGGSGTLISGRLVDPKDDRGVVAQMFYTTKQGVPVNGEYTGSDGSFNVEVQQGSSIRVEAPDYETRTVSTTADAASGVRFMRYNRAGDLTTRFNSTVLVNGSNPLQRLPGNCRTGEAPVFLDVETNAPTAYQDELRAALADMSLNTRGAYNLGGATLNPLTGDTIAHGKLRVIFTTNVPGGNIGFTNVTFNNSSNTSIDGARVYIDSRLSQNIARKVMGHEFGHVTGKYHSTNGGDMSTDINSNRDQTDNLVSNMHYCLSFGYTPGSMMTAAVSASQTGPGVASDVVAPIAQPEGDGKPTAPGVRSPEERRIHQRDPRARQDASDRNRL